MVDVDELRKIAKEVKKETLKMIHDAGSGHPAGSLSTADLMVALYFSGVANIHPDNPWDENRDRVVLSHGHTCPALYATLAYRGFFDKKELGTLRKMGSRLQGHPHYRALPGIENTSGPLGQGYSVGVGMALYAKMKNKSWHTFVLTSDGEHDEGQIWEAMLLAAKYQLDNLTVIIDYNNIQIDGTCDEVLPIAPLDEKYRAFNWNVITVDGHDFEALITAYRRALEVKGKPTAIIAKTIPGYPVKFMASPSWHGKAPNDEQLQDAIKQIEEVYS